MKATKGQLARIHIARKELGLDEETYREMLRGVAGKASAGLMNYQEASDVIRQFERRGWQPRKAQGANKGREGARRESARGSSPLRSRYEELRDRPGMATPQELRKIEAMWAQIARGNPQSTLRAFLFKRWEVSDLRFLTARQAWEVIEAVKAITARRYPRGENQPRAGAQGRRERS